MNLRLAPTAAAVGLLGALLHPAPAALTADLGPNGCNPASGYDFDGNPCGDTPGVGDGSLEIPDMSEMQEYEDLGCLESPEAAARPECMDDGYEAPAPDPEPYVAPEPAYDPPKPDAEELCVGVWWHEGPRVIVGGSVTAAA